MPKTIKGILTKAGNSTRLKYLLAKEDIDDIQTAVVILKSCLRDELPGLNISSFADMIKIENITDKHYTTIAITLKEAHLFLKYNQYGNLELFNKRQESDMELIGKVKRIIADLEFYMTEEKNFDSDNFHYMLETYKLDVIMREL